MDKRAEMKFYAKLGKSPSETYQLMQQDYGCCCLNKSNVFVWHKRFLDGSDVVEDDQLSGRPISFRAPDIIEKVQNFVANERCASLRMMVDSLNINKGTIRKILRENLGKIKVCAKFAPHTLSPEQKAMRLKPGVFNMTLKQVEKVRNVEVRKFTVIQKTRKIPTKTKTMLITFFDARGIVRKEFLQTGERYAITCQYYIAVLKCLIDRIRRIRPEYRTENSWCLSHDNTPSHTSLVVLRILAKNNVCVLNHPPYSPNLPPCDHSVFSKLKMKFKRCFLSIFRPYKWL
ncbi:protein GVQW3 [Trichonephila clavipes]|uniref:Protein GVQW3 n=1 Tax=Trichonephila clavipes TaxID=2585209 RepID=A0A8X6SMN8_TRICX|nr:protein GVQW3 [Trichonephila clavipes]